MSVFSFLGLFKICHATNRQSVENANANEHPCSIEFQIHTDQTPRDKQKRQCQEKMRIIFHSVTFPYFSIFAANYKDKMNRMRFGDTQSFEHDLRSKHIHIWSWL